ncbi:MAG: large conductance mechanosensitive channel protein MscL [Lachnospiraceae bacterium]
MKNGFIKEFKEFIMRGNVMDMAVGVIIGGAFQKIVTSLVNDIFVPVITRITGGIDFTNWFIALDGEKYKTLAAATETGAATLNYGVFITEVIQFLIMAFVIFLLVKSMNAIARKTARVEETIDEPTTKACPFCKTEIAIDASRCPHCTSQLD